MHGKLTEEFMEKYSSLIVFEVVCISQTLSPNFIVRYFDRLPKTSLCEYQVLPPSLIEQKWRSFRFSNLVLFQYTAISDITFDRLVYNFHTLNSVEKFITLWKTITERSVAYKLASPQFIKRFCLFLDMVYLSKH